MTAKKKNTSVKANKTVKKSSLNLKLDKVKEIDSSDLKVVVGGAAYSDGWVEC